MNEYEAVHGYSQLKHAVLSGTATRLEIEQFEQVVSADPKLKRDFVEFLHQEAALSIRGEESSFHLPSSVIEDGPIPVAIDAGRRIHWTHYAVLAASMLALVSTAAFVLGNRSPKPVVVLASTHNCQWGLSTLATVPGQALPPGRLVLNSGIAELKFPAVDLSIEGPADLEVLSEDRCFLRSGRVYATVHPGGEGFAIETPTSLLIDQGTVFAVSVSSEGTSDLQVFDGLVDAKHLATGESTEVRPDAGLRLFKDSTQRLNKLVESMPLERQVAQPNDALRRKQISTAVGEGRDAYVIAGEERSTTNTSGVLIVKETTADPWLRPWRRRAILHFDLTNVKPDEIAEAKLQLQGVTTGLGYLAITPDTTFSVYGVTDETARDWTPETITWKNFPGTRRDGEELNPDALRLLGKFVVHRANTTGIYSIEGNELVTYLKEADEGAVTMIVVSETTGPGEVYAHGFASSNHPYLQPPTLRLGLK